MGYSNRAYKLRFIFLFWFLINLSNKFFYYIKRLKNHIFFLCSGHVEIL